jgi:hypothetical protein
MAMCSSGNLGILSAPQAGCSSISCAVYGNATPPRSLHQLGIDSGIGIPIQMSRFYSYSQTIINLVLGSSSAMGGSNAGVCANLCFLDYHTLTAGSCYCLCVQGSLNTNGQGTSSSAFMCITCNGTCVYGCAAGANTCVPSLTKSLVVKTGDNVFMTLCAVTTSTSCGGNSSACGYISSAIPIVGNASIGSPSGCCVYTG